MLRRQGGRLGLFLAGLEQRHMIGADEGGKRIARSLPRFGGDQRSAKAAQIEIGLEVGRNRHAQVAEVGPTGHEFSKFRKIRAVPAVKSQPVAGSCA